LLTLAHGTVPRCPRRRRRRGGRRQSQARSGEGHTREALQVGAATSRIVPSPPVVKPSCSGGVGPSHAHPDRANALELVRDVSGQRVRTVLKLLEQPPNRPLYDRAPRTPRPAPFIVPAPPSLPDPPTKLLVRRPEEAWLSGYRPRAVRHRLTESRAGRFRSVAYSPCGSGSSSSETEFMQ
jgi:hypothetical protein